jgi:rhodanese-related sulfurtransferase
MSVQRIDPEQARREVVSGNALLVCAYDDQQKLQKYLLPNALSLPDFQAQEAAFPKDREIIFYCA